MISVSLKWVSESVAFASVCSTLEEGFNFVQTRTELSWKPPSRFRMLPSQLPQSKTPTAIRALLHPTKDLRKQRLVLKRTSGANKPSVQLSVIAPVWNGCSSKSKLLRPPIRAYLSLEKPERERNLSPRPSMD